MKDIVINSSNIKKMVNIFYNKVIDDDKISHFFTEKLGVDIDSKEWQEHIELVSNFWAMVALDDTKYTNNPLLPHKELKNLTRDDFNRWLKLFSESANEVYEPISAKFFIDKSVDIANNFMRKLGL